VYSYLCALDVEYTPYQSHCNTGLQTARARTPRPQDTSACPPLRHDRVLPEEADLADQDELDLSVVTALRGIVIMRPTRRPKRHGGD
jgi:hypothetical protein